MNVNLPGYAQELFRPHRYKVLYGGRGAGRSWSVARALLVKAGTETVRVLCARELQTSIRDSVHRLLADQVRILELPYKVGQGEITTPNGSLFIFEGLRHNVTKIKSIEGIDVCWVEEAERVSEESWKVLVPTIRTEGSEIWVTFNPDQEDDPTYQRFIVKQPPDAWVHKVGWRDNPWFPDVLAQEKDYDYSVDPEAAEHVWGGACRTATDAQILRKKWVLEEFESAEHWDGPYHGADFGFAQDPTTLVRCWIADRTLYVEHESYQIGLEIDATARRWEQDVEGFSAYVVRADSARPETISYLKRHGVPRIAGVDKWQGSVEDGIAHLRSYERIVIHPRCKHAAQEARNYSYQVDARTGDVLPKVLDKHNHIWDAVRYALGPLIQKRQAPQVWWPGMEADMEGAA